MAALTLLQNGIPVRIIEKEPNYHVGQRGSGIQASHPSSYYTRNSLTVCLPLKPRSLELLNYLGVLGDMQAQGTRVPLMRKYETGAKEPFRTWEMDPWLEALPDRPYVSEYMS